VEKAIAPIAFIWGLLWLIWAGGHEIETFVDYDYRRAAWVAFMGAVALGFGLASLRFSWREARWPGYALPFVLIAFALLEMTLRAHPFGGGGWVAWPFAIAALYFLLNRAGPDAKGGFAMMLHVLSVALVCLVAALEIEWVAIDNTASGTAWALASRIVAPSIVLLLISSKLADTRWPVRDHTAAYRIGAATVIVIAMALWSLHVNWAHAGGSEPLPYIPVINALDLAHILAAMAVVSAVLAVRRSGLPRPSSSRRRSPGRPWASWPSSGPTRCSFARSTIGPTSRIARRRCGARCWCRRRCRSSGRCWPWGSWCSPRARRVAPCGWWVQRSWAWWSRSSCSWTSRTWRASSG
jgi:hypothetical protein